jgi:hypothetical protein
MQEGTHLQKSECCSFEGFCSGDYEDAIFWDAAPVLVLKELTFHMSV